MCFYEFISASLIIQPVISHCSHGRLDTRRQDVLINELWGIETIRFHEFTGSFNNTNSPPDLFVNNALFIQGVKMYLSAKLDDEFI
jgi:hypothetical protein